MARAAVDVYAWSDSSAGVYTNVSRYKRVTLYIESRYMLHNAWGCVHMSRVMYANDSCHE